MCPVNSQNEEKLAQYAVSPAHGRGGSQDEVKLDPPLPMRAVARGTRRKIYYSLRLLLVPTTLVREIIILFGIYMSFSRFQYELLVHTPNTDVYRRILECRFTHFAPYVALSLAPRPSPTWWTCSNSFGLIQPERYILHYHYCSTSRRGEEPIARLIFWRCQAQGYRRTSSRCRVIYK